MLVINSINPKDYELADIYFIKTTLGMFFYANNFKCSNNFDTDYILELKQYLHMKKNVHFETYLSGIKKYYYL